MTRWAVIHLAEDGATLAAETPQPPDPATVAGIWLADTPPTSPGTWIDCGDQVPEVGWLYDGATFTPPPVTQILTIDFFNKFTPDEFIKIETAARTNAQIARGMTMANARGTIHFTNPNLKVWMDQVMLTGCITKTRYQEIMNSLQPTHPAQLPAP